MSGSITSRATAINLDRLERRIAVLEGAGMNDWSPDTVQRPDYPPPDRPDTLLRRWERWQPPEGERPVWPAGLTDTARAELLRCAEAFEATARRLRSIVDQ